MPGISTSALRADALTSVDGGFELRVGLPWIRSMPLSAVLGLTVRVDGRPVEEGAVAVALGRKRVQVEDLRALEDDWWYLQDRLVLTGDRVLAPGVHAVSVELRLLVPYLQSAPGVPLTLPLRMDAALVLDAPAVPSVSEDVA